ncbi:MAG TPA: glycosyltransferase, partial [Acidobacteriaceae bacterium]|nr:glycosyltransferase [Acidobacteriaceae bacterium]
MTQKRITIVSPCYNEEPNIPELYRRLKAMAAQLPQYRIEFLFIDNASRDNTVGVLREIAAQDPAVKVIVNARNVGHLRSPM